MVNTRLHTRVEVLPHKSTLIERKTKETALLKAFGSSIFQKKNKLTAAGYMKTQNSCKRRPGCIANQVALKNTTVIPDTQLRSSN